MINPLLNFFSFKIKNGIMSKHLIALTLLFFSGAAFAQTPCMLNCSGPITVTAPIGSSEAFVSVPNPTISGVCGTSGSTIVYSEDFENGSLPTGWATSSSSPNPAPWAVGTIFGNLFGGSVNYLYVNSDAFGNGNHLIETVVSNTFDATGNTQLTLKWDQHIRTVTSGETFDVDVWDGTAWQNVYSYVAGGNVGSFGVPDVQSIDITAYANANMQIRFDYNDNNVWGWWWAVDNIEVEGTGGGINPPVITNNSTTSTMNADGMYPVGTTTVTFTTQSPSGGNVTCTTDVIVESSSTGPNDCDPMIGLAENFDGSSGFFPANPVIVYGGQSFTAPTAAAGMVDGIKVFFSSIKGGATLPLTLHEGSGSGTISPTIATASYTNTSSSTIFGPPGVGFPVCFELNSPVSLTPGAQYYFLIATGCDQPIGCSVGFTGDTSPGDEPYLGGAALTASATFAVLRPDWDVKFSVYSGDCDDEAPIVVCNNITISPPSSGTYELSQADIDAIANGTTDNCPNFLSYGITSGQTEYDCNDVGSDFLVTLTAIDGCGNSSSCNAFVTVDGINCCTPSIVCPNPGTFECGDDAGINAWLASATANACTLTGTTVTNNYDPANFTNCNSTGNITFSLINSAGQVIADCVTSLTIDDNTPPSVVCPSDVTVECGDPTDASGTSSSILLLTEADPNSPDFIEIQNFSNNTEDYTGWFVAISDSYIDINDSNPIVWELGVMAPNEIDFRSDNPGLNYWGNNIFWNGSDASWALLIDNNGNVADAVFWGWSEANIASFNTSINGVNITIPTTVWSGDGITGSCSGNDSRNRQGTSDNNDASDWFCSESTIGTANPGLNISGGSGSGGGGSLPSATATDGCDPNPSVSYTDVFTPSSSCPEAGFITRTWTATDACGNTSTSCDQIITINPPLAPTLASISFVSSVTCAEADAFTAPPLPYSNNVSGDCLISGVVAPTVVNNWNYCDGGEIVITYSGQDDCGNQLDAGPFTITVDPAPPAVLSVPSIPSALSCAAAGNFSVGDATYTNGLTGPCGNTGSLSPSIVSNFDACGGSITVSYAGVDQCGNSISLPAIEIEVAAAPIPTITLPVLPTSLSCGDAPSFSPPAGSFSNDLPGVCNLSGTTTTLMNHFYDACGGTLEVIYVGEDDCGRNLVATVAIISIDPAPAPTIDVPSFPASLSCSDAASYNAPSASYDNGEAGVCNISGLVEPVIVYDVDACNGGTMTISYNGEDDCGNVLSATPVVVQVEAASAPTLEAPKDVPATISCFDAALGYYPGNATYSNGESGFCENSGEIVGVVTELWNNCDGGYIIYDYSGVDDCGNELTPVVIKVSVLPDTWAPVGGCAPLSETMNSIDDVPGLADLGYYLDQIAAGYDEEGCGSVVVSVVDDSGVPVCDGNDFYERIYTVEISDACGNVAGECTITFSGSCSLDLCTMDQKFYGNPDAEMNGQSSGEIVSALISDGANPIVIGDGSDCGFIIDETMCVQAMLNSFGAATSLPSGFATTCFDVNNSLINQMVVTILNIRFNETMNPAGQINFGNLLLSEACLNVPGYMLANLPANPTVSDLLQYANDFIECQCSSTCGEFLPNMAELTNLFWGLNSRFNNCNAPAPCGSDFANPNILDQSQLGNDLTVELYPNPTKDFINLNVSDYVGLPVVIEIFDTRGAKLGEKSYQTIEQLTLEIDVHNFSSGLYWLSITIEGHDQITKKFIVDK